MGHETMTLSAVIPRRLLERVRLSPTDVLASHLQDSGLSDANVWRVQAADNSWAVRCWSPKEGLRERLQLIHTAQQQALRSGCQFIAAAIADRNGSRYLEHEGRIWEIAPWLPGAPLPTHAGESSLKSQRLRNAMSALAALHSAWRRLGQQTAPPPAVRDRIRRIVDWSRSEGNRWTQQICADQTSSHFTQEWFSPGKYLERWLRLAQRAGQWWFHNGADLYQRLVDLQVPQALHASLRDVRRTHILFVDEHVTGVIDFGSMRPDWPALDLARYLAESAGSSRELWRELTEQYASSVGNRPLHVGAVLTLAEATQIIAVDTWVQWLFTAPHRFAPTAPAVIERLETLETWFAARTSGAD
jgi:Ser/Thr protein kinase RdoA (MazF antagonist)